MSLLLINIISLGALVISYFLFKMASGSMSFRKLNMISFTFYVYLLLMTFVGAVMIVNQIDDHYIVNKLKDQNVRFYGWASICYMMVMLPAGILLSKLFFPKRSTRFYLSRYINSKIEPFISTKDSHIRLFLYAFSFISVISFFYTLYYLREVPFISLLKGSSAVDISKQRSESSLGFGGIEYIRNLFGLVLAPILSYVAYCYYRQTKLKNDFYWFLIMFITSSSFLLIDLQKSPFILYLSGFLMLKVLLADKISYVRLFKYGTFAFILLLVAYIFLSEGFTSEVLFSHNYGIVGRITLTSVAGFYHSLEIFPLKIDFLGISSMSGFMADFFDLEFSERAARLIMMELYPDRIYHGTAGVTNSIFLSEAWANFGLMGILLSPVYVGFIIGLLYNFILISPKYPIFLGIYAYFSFRPTIIGGFNEYLYNPGNLFILLLVSFLLIYSRSLEAASKKKLFADKIF